MKATFETDDAFQAFLERAFCQGSQDDAARIDRLETKMGQVADALNTLKTSFEALKASIDTHQANDAAKLADLTTQLDAAKADEATEATTIADLQKQVDDLMAKLNAGGGVVTGGGGVTPV